MRLLPPLLNHIHPSLTDPLSGNTLCTRTLAAVARPTQIFLPLGLTVSVNAANLAKDYVQNHNRLFPRRPYIWA